MLKVLALDVSKSATGWTVDGEDGRPRHGTYRLQGSDLGRIGVAFGTWLDDFLSVTRPQLVIVEAPAIAGVPTSQHEALLLIGLAFEAITVAAANDIGSMTAHVQSVRKEVLGTGRPTGGKHAVMEFFRGLKWDVKTADEADSAALWCYAKLHRDRSFRAESIAPMFAKAVA